MLCPFQWVSGLLRLLDCSIYGVGCLRGVSLLLKGMGWGGRELWGLTVLGEGGMGIGIGECGQVGSDRRSKK